METIIRVKVLWTKPSFMRSCNNMNQLVGPHKKKKKNNNTRVLQARQGATGQARVASSLFSASSLSWYHELVV